VEAPKPSNSRGSRKLFRNTFLILPNSSFVGGYVALIKCCLQCKVFISLIFAIFNLSEPITESLIVVFFHGQVETAILIQCRGDPKKLGSHTPWPTWPNE